MRIGSRSAPFIVEFLRMARRDVRPAPWRTWSIGACFVAVMVGASVARVEAAWRSVPPPLPPPTGRVVNVRSEPELQAAVRALASDTTIILAPGTYRLVRTLTIRGRLVNAGIRGATGNRDDVVLQGPGMNSAESGPTPHGIWVDGGVRGLTIANLTIRDVRFHPIIFNAGPSAPHIYNVRLVNGGEQLLKVNPNVNGTGVNDGVVEYSVFEYETTSRNWYANAIQVLAGARWIIRDNLIRNIRAPRGELAGPAVLAWFSATDTVVEGNTFINCQREIAFGLIERPPHDHAGGIIRNNFIYRDASVSQGDVAIGVFDSPRTQVLHNSILISGTYPAAIEYRFKGSTAVVLANNLTDALIRARDGASASVRGNETRARTEMFVDATSGDLHLRPTALAAIGRGVMVEGAPTDWDGDKRPVGVAPYVGADEHMAGVFR